MEAFEKHSYEEWPVTFDFVDRLPTGETVSSATFSAVTEEDGSSATSTVFSATAATISGTTAIKGVKAGTPRRNYILTCKIVGSNGTKEAMNILMQVRDNR